MASDSRVYLSLSEGDKVVLNRRIVDLSKFDLFINMLLFNEMASPVSSVFVRGNSVLRSSYPLNNS